MLSCSASQPAGHHRGELFERGVGGRRSCRDKPSRSGIQRPHSSHSRLFAGSSDVEAGRGLPGPRSSRTASGAASSRYSSCDRQEIFPSGSSYRWLLSLCGDGLYPADHRIVVNTIKHRSLGGALRSVATRSTMFEENARERIRLVPTSCLVCHQRSAQLARARTVRWPRTRSGTSWRASHQVSA